MHSVTVTNVSLDELVDRMREVIPQAKPVRSTQDPVIISVLNRRGAAQALGISGALFDKLQRRGMIPPTVDLGTNNRGESMKRWCLHHIQLIRPVIHQLKYAQTDDQYGDARKKINQLLGL